MTKELKPWEKLNYTHSYWENGRRLGRGVPRLLCFETGYFGLKMDVGILTKVWYGNFPKNQLSYEGCMADRSRMATDRLTQEDLEINVILKGKTYRAKYTGASVNISQCRLWEAGRNAQHYDFLNVIYHDAQGRGAAPFKTSTFSIIIWPDAMTFSLDMTTRASSEINDLEVTIKFLHWKISSKDAGFTKKTSDTNVKMSLNCDLNNTRAKLQDWQKNFRMHIKGPSRANEVKYPLKFDKEYNCFLVDVLHPHRKFPTGYHPIRNYDEFQFQVRNLTPVGDYVPVCLYLRPPANVTGMSAMLCDEHYNPLGVPVQMSKNWHLKFLGNYAKLYMLIPSPKNDHQWNTYHLRIAYGFYGKLPSASHANLCLIGYSGHSARWEQLAVGCWGETFCMDVELDCVRNTITDIRALMCRNGARGKCWAWTDAGWGGDWLHVQNRQGHKFLPIGLKTAYISQGPCLTEVHYDAFYGSQREVDTQIRVRTCQADDYARTFTKLTYKFNHDNFNHQVNLMTYFFMLGGGNEYATPSVAFGNAHEGLQEDRGLPRYPPGKILMQQTELKGKGPWWISYHTQNFQIHNGMGKAWRGLVIRSYRAKFGSTVVDSPSISFLSTPTKSASHSNMALLIVPPKGITKFSKNDTVELEVELITIPLNRNHYYGPNVHFAQHLTHNPHSWKTVLREAKGNDIKVTKITPANTVVKQSYPLILELQNDGTIHFTIVSSSTTDGAIGALPIRFENISKYHGYKLVQLVGNKEIPFQPNVHGNDYWQTDYNESTRKYSMTVNVPMDALPYETNWMFKRA